MSTVTDKPQDDEWEVIRHSQVEPAHKDSSSFLEENREFITGIAVIALLAISFLVIGGLLLHFKVNAIAAYALISVGAGLGLGTLVSGVILYLDRDGALTEDEFHATQ